MRGWPLVVCLLAGCHEVFGVARPASDGASEDDSARPCDPGAPFGPGIEVPISSAYGVEAARFNARQSLAYLSLHLASEDKDKSDLYQAFYDPDTRAFMNYVKMDGISSDLYDSYPTVTRDGQHILYGTAEGGLRVWVAVAQDESFDNPSHTEALALPSGKQVSNEPYILGDGQTLYFAAGQGWDLYRMTGSPPSFGGAPEPVEGANETTSSEFAPVVADDELEIFFASDRDRPRLDIFTATRARATDPFGMPQRIDHLSTATGIDWPVWLSPERCVLYYINKPVAPNGTEGAAVLYVARR